MFQVQRLMQHSRSFELLCGLDPKEFTRQSVFSLSLMLAACTSTPMP